MKPSHVHLHVRDIQRAKRFYQKWFGLLDGPEFGDISFLRSREGFDLALSLDSDPAPLPEWFHWGFKLQNAAAVRHMHDRMEKAGVPILKPPTGDDDVILFRCADPDGYAVELYFDKDMV